MRPLVRRPPPPVYRCCKCGAMAHYGVGVSVRKKTGRWYCAAHYELTPEGQTRIADQMREATEGA